MQLVALAARPQQPREDAPVQVWGRAPGGGAASFFRSVGGYVLRFNEIADFLLSDDGALVRCHPAQNAQAAWEPIYRQQVLPLQRAQQGQPVFHGGAVCRDGQAIAMLGPSGQGKSTLTAACAQAGWAFLTDDCLVLDESDGIHVLPDADHVRLWADSFRALTGTEPGAVDPDCRKPRLLAGQHALRQAVDPGRLACMLLLEEAVGEAIELVPLSPADAAMAWCANAFVVDQRDPAVLRRGLARGAMLAQAAPGYRLVYPRDYARLPEVMAVVSDCLVTATSNAA